MKKYTLADPERAAYFVQAYWDGSYSAIDARTMDEAVERMLMMTDFELAVDKRRFWQGLDKEDACAAEITQVNDKIVRLNGQQVLEHAGQGHEYPVRWGWVKVTD